MAENIKANLGIGPMSSETIEAVYRFSNFHRKQIMLIASKNQIDYSGGYVNKWTTKEYAERPYFKTNERIIAIDEKT